MYDRTDDILLHYEWDPSKAKANRAKHGVAFVDAIAVLENEHSVTAPGDAIGECRRASIGLDALGRTLTVIWTWRGECVRIISARRATASERAAMKWKR